MNLELAKLVAACLFLLSLAAGPAPADVRFRRRVTGPGQPPGETTTYLKGTRQRVSFGPFTRKGKRMDTAFVWQCDLKRFIWLDNENRVYTVEDLDFRGNDEAFAYYESLAADPTSTYAQQLARARAERERLPVTVTAVTTVTDTGERRQMFGYTARRIKTVTTWESSPDKCGLRGASLETDGWYIDLLYGLECSTDISGAEPFGALPVRFSVIPPGECGERIAKSKYRFESKTQGSARFGFPVLLTRTSRDRRGRAATYKEEVLELSAEELDDALFEIPQGYAQTTTKSK